MSTRTVTDTGGLVLQAPPEWIAKAVPGAMITLTAINLIRKKHNPRIGTESNLREKGRCISVVCSDDYSSDRD